MAHPALTGEMLDALLDVLAERLADKLAARTGAAVPAYADAKNNPLGSPRAFLDAARRGDFPSFKRGRNVAARWEDVAAYIESRRRAPRPPVSAEDDDVAMLEAAGLQLQAPRKGAR